MIRHSSSFLFSIVVHVVLFLIVLFLYNSYIKKKEPINCEKRVCVKLCDIQCEKKIEPKKKKQKAPSLRPKPRLPIKQKKEKKKIPKKKVVSKKQIKIKKEKPKIIVKKVIQENKQLEIQKSKPKEIEKKVKKEFETTIVEAEVISPIKNLEPSSENLNKKYIQSHIAKIVKLLQENLYYPRRARKKGITGEVMVKFTLGVDATVSNVEVLKSKREILSRAAMKTIQDLSGEFPRPDQELSISVPISYKLVN